MLRWTEGDALDEGTWASLLGPGGFFELVDEEVLGATVPVFATRARSVGELVERAAGHGDRPALVDDEGALPYAELPGAVAAQAGRLAAAGVRPGDRVLLAGEPSAGHALTVLAAMAMGATATEVNPRAPEAELAHAVEATTPVLAVVDPGVADHLPPALASTTFAELSASPTPDPAPAAATVAEDDPCAIVFTSGTTGRPKGAVLSHRNAVHFTMTSAATALVRRMAADQPASSGRPQAVIASSPLFHVSGLLGQLLNAVAWGTTQVYAPPGRWDPTTHLELTDRHQVTIWSLVPTQLWRLIEHPELDRFDLSSLEAVGGGGATFPPELLRRAGEVLPGVSSNVRVGYGMTESSGLLTMLVPPAEERALASVGGAVAGTEVEVRDPVTGEPVPDGEVGEIAGRSAGIFLGYWGDEDATAAVLDADRWYATGDFGRIEDGKLFLESRRSDLIIRGGENVYPIEVENRLVEHPAIADAAVVGVPHRELGQEVKAVVVPVEGATVDPDDVRAFVREALAGFKVPAIVEVRHELPRNDTGKVLKSQLVDERD